MLLYVYGHLLISISIAIDQLLMYARACCEVGDFIGFKCISTLELKETFKTENRFLSSTEMLLKLLGREWEE